MLSKDKGKVNWDLLNTRNTAERMKKEGNHNFCWAMRTLVVLAKNNYLSHRECVDALQKFPQDMSTEGYVEMVTCLRELGHYRCVAFTN
jgi:hypothetical protein